MSMCPLKILRTPLTAAFIMLPTFTYRLRLLPTIIPPEYHSCYSERLLQVSLYNYDYAAGQYSPQTGHFTQMVWQATTQIGCGATRCAAGPLYVCHYSPPGNVIGQFVQNVLPPAQ